MNSGHQKRTSHEQASTEGAAVKIGVFSNAISGASPEEVAQRSRAAGVESVQLRLEWPGLDLLGSAADRAQVRWAYQDAGIEIAALAAYTNLLAHDPAARQANRAYCTAALRAAPELGTPLVVTETGSYHPHDSWSDHPHNRSPEAWAELVDVTRDLTAVARSAGAVLVYEPYVNNVLSSADATRRLIDEVGSPALACVFDPAGLVTPSTLPHNQEVTREALETLRGHIALVHADDVRYEGEKARWLPLGWGDLDADAVFAGLVHSGYTGAVIVEHLSETLVPQALAYCHERVALLTGGPAEGMPASPAGKGGVELRGAPASG
jgi:sugar phosphate isomerase/epimerase